MIAIGNHSDRKESCMAIETLPFETTETLFLEPLILSSVSEMKEQAQSLIVNNESAFKEITSLYKKAKEWEKIIENRRKEANAPNQARINARNDRAKDLTDPLKTIQSLCKMKSGQYQQEQERAHEEKNEALLLGASLFDEDNITLPEPAKKLLRGDGATVYSKTEKRFRVVDMEKVPRKYLMLNEDLIKKDIKLGIANIEGIEIYDEKVTQIKVR